MVTLKLSEHQETKFLVLLSDEDRETLVHGLYAGMKVSDTEKTKSLADKLETLFEQFQSLNL